MEIFDVLIIMLKSDFVLKDRAFIEQTVRQREIDDLPRLCETLANYFIWAENKSLDNVYNLEVFNLFSSLKQVFFEYLSFKKGISDDYKVYPLHIKSGAEEIFKEYLQLCLSKYLADDETLTYYLERIIMAISFWIGKKELVLEQADIKPFYGDEYYIKHRIIYTASKVLELVNSDVLDESTKEVFQNYSDILVEYVLELPNLNMQGDYDFQKKVYDVLESYYKNLLSIENILAPYIERIWNDRLLSDRFCGLAHGFTKEEFDPEEADKICASYFDERYISIVGNYGYLYPMYMEKCDMISGVDEYSEFITKKEFIHDIENWAIKLGDENFRGNLYMPVYTYSGDERSMNYQFPNYTRLLTPDMVLEENYKRALQNKLIYDTMLPFGIGYNEIVFIDKDKNLKPIGVWVRKGEAKVYRKALNLSRRTNLPLMVIDVAKLKKNYQKQKKSGVKKMSFIDN